MDTGQMTPALLGERLIILGMGIGGCFAAAGLSRFFAETLILDKDTIPDGPVQRPGVPQGTHIHGLLRRPFDLACEYIPGFEDKLRAAGALCLTTGSEVRFHDAGTWHPKRNLEVGMFAQSRPVLEHVLRKCVLKSKNVALRDRTALVDYVLDGHKVTGVVVKNHAGAREIIDGDLIIDATGRMGPIGTLLKQHGYADLASTELGVDIGYTSALYTRAALSPDEKPTGSVIRASPPRTRSGVLWPIEDDRWIVSMSGRFRDFPPANDEEFLAFARTLEDPLLYETISREKRVSTFTRFMIPRIFWRHYEKMARFPDRLIPIGDTVTCFNPVYGQGMAVAAMTVEEVRLTLAKLTANRQTLDGVAREAVSRVAKVTEWAWSMSEPVDLIFEQTTGVRPQGFSERIAFSRLIRQSLEAHPDLHYAFNQVWNLLAPPSVLKERAIHCGLMPPPTVKAQQHA